MNQTLRTCLYYLGKYVNDHEDVKNMNDGELMTFTIVIKKKSPGVIQLSYPCLTQGVVNTNEVKPDDSAVMLIDYANNRLV